LALILEEEFFGNVNNTNTSPDCFDRAYVEKKTCVSVNTSDFMDLREGLTPYFF